MEGEENNWGRHGFMMRVEWLSAQNHAKSNYAALHENCISCTKYNLNPFFPNLLLTYKLSLFRF